MDSQSQQDARNRRVEYLLRRSLYVNPYPIKRFPHQEFLSRHQVQSNRSSLDQTSDDEMPDLATEDDYVDMEELS